MKVTYTPDFAAVLEIRHSDMATFNKDTGFGLFHANPHINFENFHLQHGATTLIAFNDLAYFAYPCTYEDGVLLVRIEEGVSSKGNYRGWYNLCCMVERAKTNGGQFEVNETDHFQEFEYICDNTSSFEHLTKLIVNEKCGSTEIVVVRDFNDTRARFHVCLPAYMGAFKVVQGADVC